MFLIIREEPTILLLDHGLLFENLLKLLGLLSLVSMLLGFCGRTLSVYLRLRSFFLFRSFIIVMATGILLNFNWKNMCSWSEKRTDVILALTK